MGSKSSKRIITEKPPAYAPALADDHVRYKYLHDLVELYRECVLEGRRVTAAELALEAKNYLALDPAMHGVIRHGDAIRLLEDVLRQGMLRNHVVRAGQCQLVVLPVGH